MDRPRYLVIETQNFSGSGEGPAKTSFLRIGGIADAKLVETEERMRASTPAAGAVTAATGAGEDLAARVQHFHDDDRDRCDPPHLDADDRAAADAIAADDEVLVAKRKLDEAKARLDAIDAVLFDVIDDPAAFLDGLYERADAAATRRDELAARFAEAAARQRAAAAAPRASARPHFAPGYQTQRERQAETARLHTKGGWRDHTDGNRIITTRGDKIEVVRGNYKQVVLGRQNAPMNAADGGVLPGQEISGGHVLEPSIAVVQQTEIAWKRRQNGTWHTLETTTKADTCTHTAGDHTTEAFGHWRRSTTGSDAPSGAWHAAKDCPGASCDRPNPKLRTEVWATSLHTRTGSSKCPVGDMKDETHVAEMRSELHATRMTDRITTGEHSVETSVDGEMTTRVAVGQSATVRDALVVLERVTTPVMASLVAGETDTRFDGAHSIATLGTSTDVQLGGELAFTAPRSINLAVGGTLNAFVGAKLDVNIGASTSITVGVNSSLSTATVVQVACVAHSKAAPIVAVMGGMVMVG